MDPRRARQWIRRGQEWIPNARANMDAPANRVGPPVHKWIRQLPLCNGWNPQTTLSWALHRNLQ
eukprot:8282473-Lingulodinium_polyedra.AAC.1